MLYEKASELYRIGPDCQKKIDMCKKLESINLYAL